MVGDHSPEQMLQVALNCTEDTTSINAVRFKRFSVCFQYQTQYSELSLI